MRSSRGLAGTVTKIGKEVKDFVRGDRVYCLCSSKLGQYARVQSSLCQKIEGMNSFEVGRHGPKASQRVTYLKSFPGNGCDTRRILLSGVWADAYSPVDSRRSTIFNLLT